MAGQSKISSMGLNIILEEAVFKRSLNTEIYMRTFLIETILPWILGIVFKVFGHKKKTEQMGGSKMDFKLIYSLVQKEYCEVLHNEVHKLVNKSDSKVDDVMAGILDKIFSCPENK